MNVGDKVNTSNGEGIVERIIYTYPHGKPEEITSSSVVVLIGEKISFHKIKNVAVVL